jgi:hypothetical protein
VAIGPTDLSGGIPNEKRDGTCVASATSTLVLTTGGSDIVGTCVIEEEIGKPNDFGIPNAVKGVVCGTGIDDMST